MRITLIIESDKEMPTWAKLLDCDRYCQKHSEFIIENYNNLPDISIFAPENIFDCIEDIDYFTIQDLCRNKIMPLQITPMCKNWNVVAIKKQAIQLINKEYFQNLNREDVIEVFKKYTSI